MNRAPLISSGGQKLHVAVFTSGGPGNLSVVYAVADELPDLLEVSCVVTDRLGIPSIGLAHERNTAVIARDFGARCGPRPPAQDIEAFCRYQVLTEALHDEILNEMEVLEHERKIRIDFLVLAYRRIIQGHLLERFRDRVINQHPADLARLDESSGARLYAGISGAQRACRRGEQATRTSTILVNSGVDTGEILCQGPWVPWRGSCERASDLAAHELQQKRLSDWPSLNFALRGMVGGRFWVGEHRHTDGCRVIYLDGVELPYSGYSVESSGNATQL